MDTTRRRGASLASSPSHLVVNPQRAPLRIERTLWVSGSVVEVHATRSHREVPATGGVRGVVETFSSASRRRLLRAWGSLPWGQVEGRWVMVTLTYPLECAPQDGDVLRRHREAFRSAWERRWGHATGAWKREFTRRGVAHLHLWMAVPVDVPIGVVREWCSATWYRIVDSHLEKHLAAGTQVLEAMSHPALYAAGYVSGGQGAKDVQHVIPEVVCPECAGDEPACDRCDGAGVVSWPMPGRWWGYWGFTRTPMTERLTQREWAGIRRILHRWRMAQIRQRTGRRPAVRGPQRDNAVWVLGPVYHPETLVAAILRWLSQAREGPPVGGPRSGLCRDAWRLPVGVV